MSNNLKILSAVIFLFLSCFTLTTNNFAQNPNSAKELNNSIPQKARDLMKNGVKLAVEQDKTAEGLEQLKQAIAIAPQFLPAHREYIRIKAYWLNKGDEAQAEYETLMKKEPDNPVYPLALAQGLSLAPRKNKNVWFAKAAELAPEWAWVHFAKSMILEATNAESSLAELLEAIEKDPTETQFYMSAITALIRQKKLDEARTLFEKLPPFTDQVLKLNLSWDLQLARENNSTEGLSKLNAELESLAITSRDINTLKAVRLRYRRLKNEDKMKEVEAKIIALDPNWYAEQGEIMFTINFEESPKPVYFAGRQNQISRKLKDIEPETEPFEQIAEIEKLFALNPNQNNKKSIHQRLLSLSIKTKDIERAIKYGELLLADNPNDVSVLTDLTKIYVGQKDFKKAKEYSQKAMELTKEFRLAQRPNDIEERMFNAIMPESQQKENYYARRSNVLNSRALVLAETGETAESETLLLESLALRPSEEAYSQMEKILRKLGRTAEADKTAAEGANLWRNKITAGFNKELSKDFELTTIKGEKIKLSALKGKTVMINYWATWCVPCVKEMPILVELYDKYKSQGLEILAISVDSPEDRPKVPPFVEKTRINFPVLYDESSAQSYGVNSYPTTIFVDREGNVRYRAKGMDTENAKRNLEFIILEVMKNGS